MAKTVAIGVQDFERLITGNFFYVDKTYFIKEWWESGDSVTLITRPRRFGKTLAMSMLEHFFSVDYAGQVHYLKPSQFGRKKATGRSRGVIRSSACLSRRSNKTIMRRRSIGFIRSLQMYTRVTVLSGTAGRFQM